MGSDDEDRGLGLISTQERAPGTTTLVGLSAASTAVVWQLKEAGVWLGRAHIICESTCSRRFGESARNSAATSQHTTASDGHAHADLCRAKHTHAGTH